VQNHTLFSGVTTDSTDPTMRGKRVQGAQNWRLFFWTAKTQNLMQFLGAKMVRNTFLARALPRTLMGSSQRSPRSFSCIETAYL